MRTLFPHFFSSRISYGLTVSQFSQSQHPSWSRGQKNYRSGDNPKKKMVGRAGAEG